MISICKWQCKMCLTDRKNSVQRGEKLGSTTTMYVRKLWTSNASTMRTLWEQIAKNLRQLCRHYAKT